MTGEPLPDIQDTADSRGIAIDQVGITGVRYPTTLRDGQLVQAAIADFEIAVKLASERRGTHMSRMVELIDQELSTLDPRDLQLVAKRALQRLDADSVTITAELPVALETRSPASGRIGQQVHDVRLSVIVGEGESSVAVTVTSDITSLCPCSKAISDYGAHNQRSRVSVTVWGIDDPYPFSIRSIVELIRSVGSAPVYPIVKRPDERHITMLAFDRPAFVEDIVRDVSMVLRKRQLDHTVSARNVESIHSHDAYARLQWSASDPSSHGCEPERCR